MPLNHDFEPDLDLEEDDTPIEAYCVRCRQSIEMEDPVPVWTRKGAPGTRGECPICGGTVFRMGKTHKHVSMTRPAAVQVAETPRARTRLAQSTAYINFSIADEEIAQQIADDLTKVGIACWLHELEKADNVNWAGGVHPALTECSRMVLVLSPLALATGSVNDAWRYFKEKRKPIVIAQISADASPPDEIRRSPRFDFTRGDYKAAFRQMVQALGS